MFTTERFQYYRLLITGVGSQFQNTSKNNTTFSTIHTWHTSPGKWEHYTIKHRNNMIAFFRNHQLILTVPEINVSKQMIQFSKLPAGWTIRDLRYKTVTPRLFSDDFMRTDVMNRNLLISDGWDVDPIWHVAWYKYDEPGRENHDPETGLPLCNPWTLSLFPYSGNTTNAFWMIYTGCGPSFIVTNPHYVNPSWDSYYVETAAKTGQSGAIGVIAAYQDNRNYLLFRWRQRNAKSKDCAALIAIIEGNPHTLATSSQGCLPDQWYKLRINLGWRRVQALVDGKLFLEAENPGMAEGRIGLFAEGTTEKERAARAR